MCTMSYRIPLLVIATAVLTAAVVLLTPLRYIQIVEPSINDTDAEKFYADFSQNPDNYVFIDVRPADAFKKIHAQGSVSMPLHTLYDMRKVLPKHGKEVVLICSGGYASGVGYSYLEHYGFRNIARIEGGIEQWSLRGLPVDSGALSSQ